MCRADVPCEPGTARDPDLVCRGDDPEQPLATDTGVSEAEELDTGLAESDEADLPATEGPGRVRVVWTGLSGVPLHGVVVMATVVFLMAFLAGADWFLGEVARRILIG